MTKYARLHSIEHGIRQALAILGDRGAEAALESALGLKRSASLLRKCGDPDNGANQIQQRYSVALDAACVRAGHLPPLLEAHRHLVERLAGDAAGHIELRRSDLSSMVLVLQGALGRLAEAVVEAQDPRSPAGRRLSNREKHEIFEAVVRIEEHSETLKRMLED